MDKEKVKAPFRYFFILTDYFSTQFNNDTELLDRYFITKGFKSIELITLLSRKESRLCLKFK